MLMFAFTFCACAHAMNPFYVIKQAAYTHSFIHFYSSFLVFLSRILYFPLSTTRNGNIQWKQKKSHTEVKWGTHTQIYIER